VSPVPDTIQVVVSTFKAVQHPYAANVRDPVAPVPARYMVSVVMAIVTVLIKFTNEITVPCGYATLALAGIVKVRALLSVRG